MYMLDLCTTVFRYLSFDLTFWTSPWETKYETHWIMIYKRLFREEIYGISKEIDINYDTMCKADSLSFTLSLSLWYVFLLKILSPDMQICFCSYNYHLVLLIHCMVSVFFSTVIHVFAMHIFTQLIDFLISSISAQHGPLLPPGDMGFAGWFLWFQVLMLTLKLTW